ncbi:MAG TPA: pre-peptidase C-terminal domain-containing protein [Steroidobacteraceae bacterium]|nr:pre-peptidase C-terminal domain-containing protein [Steroidobacteraceae bacterium]
MDKQRNLRGALLSAVLAAFGASGIALAETEREPNNDVASAQPLSLSAVAVDVSTSGVTVQPKGSATVNGVIGNLTGTPSAGTAIYDVDFYSFQGTAGDVVTIDIDGGYGGVSNVDTRVAIFGPSLNRLRENDDSTTVDPGSTNFRDSLITNVSLPETGTYIVSVSSYPCEILDGGLPKVNVCSNPITRLDGNGDYTLIISGVTLQVQQINIEIKPGSGEYAPINPKSNGVIPVALLSSSQFNALTVDPTTLTFGRTGDEQSWLRCGKGGGDVNSDGYLDLICHFRNRSAEFTLYDTEGIVRGKMKPEAGGTLFEGRGMLKVVPVKRQD